MPANPIQRKTRNSFLLGMLIMLIIAVAVVAVLYFTAFSDMFKGTSSTGKGGSVYTYKLIAPIKSGEVIAANKVEKVKLAVKIAKERRPDLKIDGEFQLDTAIVPEVAKKKVKRESDVAGRANILIFPDLNAGNIGVKLIQQFGQADAYGPLLQGFRKVCSDCSRSAPVSELVGNILFSIVRAGDLKSEKR